MEPQPPFPPDEPITKRDVRPRRFRLGFYAVPLLSLVLLVLAVYYAFALLLK